MPGAAPDPEGALAGAEEPFLAPPLMMSVPFALSLLGGPPKLCTPKPMPPELPPPAVEEAQALPELTLPLLLLLLEEEDDEEEEDEKAEPPPLLMAPADADADAEEEEEPPEEEARAVALPVGSPNSQSCTMVSVCCPFQICRAGQGRGGQGAEPEVRRQRRRPAAGTSAGRRKLSAARKQEHAGWGSCQGSVHPSAPWGSSCRRCP